MAIKYINRNTLTNIADAIREKKELPPSHKMYVNEFVQTLENGAFNWAGRENKILFVGWGASEDYNSFTTDNIENHSFSNRISYQTETGLSPYCGNNVKNMAYAFWECRKFIGSPMCGKDVIDMSNAYVNCRNLTGSPVCGPNVINFFNTYSNCKNLTGSPVCGPNVIDMRRTYADCSNLTGSPICGPNVTDMTSTYYFCNNLTGSPVCGENVTNLISTYAACNNITGSPICGPNVISMQNAYSACRKITGSPVCGPKVINMQGAYTSCVNIGETAYIGPNVNNVLSCFSNTDVLDLFIDTTNNGANFTVALNNTRNQYGTYIYRNIFVTNSFFYDNISNICYKMFNQAQGSHVDPSQVTGVILIDRTVPMTEEFLDINIPIANYMTGKLENIRYRHDNADEPDVWPQKSIPVLDYYTRYGKQEHLYLFDFSGVNHSSNYSIACDSGRWHRVI